MILETVFPCGQSAEMLHIGVGEDGNLGSSEEQPYSIIDAVTGLRQFPCENCEKQFTDPSNLQRHIRSQHVGARSHACPECGKTFATSSGLKQHQHIHRDLVRTPTMTPSSWGQSSVKPFQCEVCLKAYTQFSNLCRHKRMHADCRQQIKCKDCGQAFSTMTSLSKHKRFCEGMLRSNGPSRNPFTGMPATPDKAPSVSIMSPVHNQASALTAYFYGPRPPFPFYPPLGAAGFSMFPGSHPIAPPMMADGKFPVAMQKVSPVSPGSVSLPGQNGEVKREKHGSEGSEGDSSEVSSASDLDTTTGSDGDSELGFERKMDKSALRAHLNGTLMPSSSSHRRPRSPGMPPPAHDFSINRNKSVKDDERPFDLSKSSPTATSGDQPLDLSVKVKEVTPDNTPRKTHIFGSREKKRASPRETPPPTTTTERKLHYAYPMSSPGFMDPMYRVDKEKLQSYQEAARMMFGPPRLSMHNAVPFGPLAGGMGLMPGRHDATKILPPMLGKPGPDHFQYSAGVNKPKERYACKFCGKIFPRSANLTRHLRTHTGEQPYKCKYCERSFSISSNLQRHVRNIHNKEKPFKCPLCDRCFGQQTNLDRHLKKHESEGPNVMDSPLHNEQELEEKDESYFDEIRNFIGKATAESSCSDESPNSKKDYEGIDANFSITAQIGKQSQLTAEKRSSPGEQDEEDDADLEEFRRKKARVENNNIDESNAPKAMLSNGFHGDDEEEDEDEEEEGSIAGICGVPNLKTIGPPLACSS